MVMNNNYRLVRIIYLGLILFVLIIPILILIPYMLTNTIIDLVGILVMFIMLRYFYSISITRNSISVYIKEIGTILLILLILLFIHLPQVIFSNFAIVNISKSWGGFNTINLFLFLLFIVVLPVLTLIYVKFAYRKTNGLLKSYYLRFNRIYIPIYKYLKPFFVKYNNFLLIAFGIIATSLLVTSSLVFANNTNLHFAVIDTPSSYATGTLNKTNYATYIPIKTKIGNFTSQSLGISFDYVTSNINTAGLQEIITPYVDGNRVYLHDSLEPMNKGSEYVEVFNKPVNESLQDYIQANILKGYSSLYCGLETNVYASILYLNDPSYITNELFYKRAAIGGDGDDIIHQCPEPYTNLIQDPDIRLYFLMDKQNPSKALFFEVPGSNGPVVGSSDKKLMWEQTIKVL